jgi:acyl-CoA thioester hydrolase
MTKFPVQIKIPIAWGDMDAFGHVNNVIYMRYFETARVRYFDALMAGKTQKSTVQPVLASIAADYKYPVVYPDTLTVKVGVHEIGNSSLKMSCEMHNKDGILAVKASCVIVMFDFATKKPAAVPADLRSYIEELEA